MPVFLDRLDQRGIRHVVTEQVRLSYFPILPSFVVTRIQIGLS